MLVGRRHYYNVLTTGRLLTAISILSLHLIKVFLSIPPRNRQQGSCRAFDFHQNNSHSKWYGFALAGIVPVLSSHSHVAAATSWVAQKCSLNDRSEACPIYLAATIRKSIRMVAAVAAVAAGVVALAALAACVHVGDKPACIWMCHFVPHVKYPMRSDACYTHP